MFHLLRVFSFTIAADELKAIPWLCAKKHYIIAKSSSGWRVFQLHSMYCFCQLVEFS